MDIISHLLWSLTIFGNVLDWKPILIILLVSILPDLPWIDYYIYKLKNAKSKKLKLLSFFRSDKGNVLKYLQEEKPNFLRETHFFLHSLFGWIVFSLIVLIFFPLYSFLSLVYFSHLFIDVFTHTGARGPVLFYPFSREGFPGWEFEENKWMVIVSYGLLVLINLIVFVIKLY